MRTRELTTYTFTGNESERLTCIFDHCIERVDTFSNVKTITKRFYIFPLNFNGRPYRHTIQMVYEVCNIYSPDLTNTLCLARRANPFGIRCKNQADDGFFPYFLFLQTRNYTVNSEFIALYPR